MPTYLLLYLVLMTSHLNFIACSNFLVILTNLSFCIGMLLSTATSHLFCLYINSSLVLDKSDFFIGNVINAIVSQVMILLREKGLELIRDIPEEIKVIAASGLNTRGLEHFGLRHFMTYMEDHM